MKIAFYSPLDPTLVGGMRSWFIDFWRRYLATRQATLRILTTGTRPSRQAESYLSLPSDPRMSIARLQGAVLPGSGGRLPSERALACSLEGCDVCYFDNGYALQDVVVLNASQKARVPVISGHHAVIKFGGLHDIAWNSIGRRMLRRFDAVHALNRPDAHYLRSVGGRNVHRIPISIDLEAFIPRTQRAEQFTVLFVGRLHYQKGIDRLIRIVEFAYKRYRDAMRFVIVGSGPLQSDLKRIASFPNVMLHASADRDTVAEFMARAHALIVPSRWETFGIVAAEALASGTPILATDTAGMREMAADGRGEIIYKPDDPAVWCTTLEAMMARYQGDASYSGEVAAVARKYAEKAFAFERTAELLDALIDSVVRLRR